MFLQRLMFNDQCWCTGTFEDFGHSFGRIRCIVIVVVVVIDVVMITGTILVATITLLLLRSLGSSRSCSCRRTVDATPMDQFRPDVQQHPDHDVVTFILDPLERFEPRRMFTQDGIGRDVTPRRPPVLPGHDRCP